MEWLEKFAHALWGMTLEMAPWLFLGFALAGLLRVLLPSQFAQKYLGAGARYAPLKASLLGMPMPLCSCSVIPVAAHLRKTGAGAKASLSFLTATPTNGLDSMLPTLAVLGPGFMVLRPVFAFLSGLGVAWATPESPAPVSEQPAVQEKQSFWVQLRRGMEYAFGDLVRDTRRWILIGLVLAALIEVLMPQTVLASMDGWMAYALVILIAMPMYVCSTGSLPIAAALMGKGLSAGAAFLFITLGPATSTATIAFVFGTFGRRVGLRWLLALAGMALGVAILIDTVLPSSWFLIPNLHQHQHHESLFGALGTMLFLGVLAKSYLGDLRFGRSHHNHHSHSKEECMIHEYTVPDMSCGNCARSIENRLGESGHQLLDKDLGAKTIRVQSDKSKEEVAEILRKSGFPPV